jgi:chromosomal replication initiation ATPase DnaA
MPTVHDIVKEALKLALKDLNVEPLVQEGVWNRTRSKSKYSKYYTKNVTIVNSAEAAAKRLATFQRSQETKVNIKKFNELEQSVMSIICRVHKVNIEDFIRLRRGRELVDARFQFAAVFRLQFYYTLSKIGFLLSKDHSSIIHSIKKHKDFYDTISSYKAQYVKVLNEIEKEYPGLLNTTLNPNIILVEDRRGWGKKSRTLVNGVFLEHINNEKTN